MIGKAWTLIVAGAVLALAATSFNAVAQSGASEGYWRSGPADAVWKNPFGMCWRSGYWTPAMATAECDPDLAPKPAAAPAPRAAPPPPPPPPKPAPKPKPVAAKVTFAADVLFDFDKATIKPAGK